MARLILGIESTAHTFSFGYVDTEGKLYSSKSALFKPESGGIHPREAADHHTIQASNLISQLNSDCLLMEKGVLTKKLNASEINSVEKARDLLSLHN